MKLNETQISAMTKSWYEALIENNKDSITDDLYMKIAIFINDLRISLHDIILDTTKATMLLVGARQFCPLKGNHSPVLAKLFNDLTFKHKLLLENFPYGAKMVINRDGMITFEKNIRSQVICIYSAKITLVLPFTDRIIDNEDDKIYSVVQKPLLFDHKSTPLVTPDDDKKEKQSVADNKEITQKGLHRMARKRAVEEKYAGKRSKPAGVFEKRVADIKFTLYNGPDNPQSEVKKSAEENRFSTML